MSELKGVQGQEVMAKHAATCAASAQAKVIDKNLLNLTRNFIQRFIEKLNKNSNLKTIYSYYESSRFKSLDFNTMADFIEEQLNEELMKFKKIAIIKQEAVASIFLFGGKTSFGKFLAEKFISGNGEIKKTQRIASELAEILHKNIDSESYSKISERYNKALAKQAYAVKRLKASMKIEQDLKSAKKHIGGKSAEHGLPVVRSSSEGLYAKKFAKAGYTYKALRATLKYFLKDILEEIGFSMYLSNNQKKILIRNRLFPPYGAKPVPEGAKKPLVDFIFDIYIDMECAKYTKTLDQFMETVDKKDLDKFKKIIAEVKPHLLSPPRTRMADAGRVVMEGKVVPEVNIMSLSDAELKEFLEKVVPEMNKLFEKTNKLKEMRAGMITILQKYGVSDPKVINILIGALFSSAGSHRKTGINFIRMQTLSEFRENMKSYAKTIESLGTRNAKEIKPVEPPKVKIEPIELPRGIKPIK